MAEAVVQGEGGMLPAGVHRAALHCSNLVCVMSAPSPGTWMREQQHQAVTSKTELQPS